MALPNSVLRAVAATLVVLGSGSGVIAAPVEGSNNLPRLIENSLAERDGGPNIQSPVDGLPGCSISKQGSGDNQDPTWAVGKSAYSDGQGKYIGSDCDTGHGKNHCWTDYFLVGTQESYHDWYPAIGDIQCSGNGSTCAQATSQMSQKCTTTTWSVSETISTEFSFELAKVGFSLTVTAGQSYQSCNGNTTTETCTWTDGQCHSVWAAQRITTVHGYKRRRCNSPTNDPNANVQNAPADGDAYTRGMMDFAIPLADGNAINCNGTCSSSYNPGPLPVVVGGSDLKPWTA